MHLHVIFGTVVQSNFYLFRSQCWLPLFLKESLNHLPKTFKSLAKKRLRVFFKEQTVSPSMLTTSTSRKTIITAKVTMTITTHPLSHIISNFE